MKVLKFGGSSLANGKNIERVKDIIIESSKEKKLVCVFSAFGNTTDDLLNAGNLAKLDDDGYKQIITNIESTHFDIIEEILNNEQKAHVISEVRENINELENLLEGIAALNEFSLKTSDKILSFGEKLSSFILHKYFVQENLDADLIDSQNAIKTEKVHGGARILIKETYSRIKKLNLDKKVSVVPGFLSTDLDNNITTLGRGGSDYTASLFAAALKAEELQVWKDVNGMLTTNPMMVESAKTIERLSYEEALELSHFGANVLYPPTVQPALINKIPIRIKNTFDPSHPGSLITDLKEIEGLSPVRGISSIADITLITISGTEMFGLPGFSKRFFETLSRVGINVMMITQGSSEHSITVAIMPEQADTAYKAINDEFNYEVGDERLRKITLEKDLSIVSLVGSLMKNHSGISGKMFSVLGNNGINIRAIAQGSAETNITCVINKEDVRKALNVLNESFFETEVKEINLFIVGIGNVGGKLIEQIKSQQKFLEEEKLLKLKIIGIANSRNMLIDANGIDLDNWKTQIGSERKTNLDELLSQVKVMNLRNSIFVDNTASGDVAKYYESFLKLSVGVVTCNKIAASDALPRYKTLKKLSKDHSAPFLYETNVGAGLPIIETLKSLISSGDVIRNIQAVLSGSLNFIFNEFVEGVNFYDVVKKAQDEGYTEPDPRIDLSFVDVARKILILSRECGYQIGIEDVVNENFLDKKYFEGEVEDFYALLKENASYFETLRKKAENNKTKLKVVASLEQGKAKVSLQEIPQGHPFYQLEGKDNIVMLYTDRYPEQPMIIKGAGAGADVTASGIFADIIRSGSLH